MGKSVIRDYRVTKSTALYWVYGYAMFGVAVLAVLIPVFAQYAHYYAFSTALLGVIVGIVGALFAACLWFVRKHPWKTMLSLVGQTAMVISVMLLSGYVLGMAGVYEGLFGHAFT